MKIQVLGSGCMTCKKLFEITQQAVEELDIQDKPEYITGAQGMKKIVDLGVMQSPVLTVNDQVAIIGFVADVEKIKNQISNVLEKNS